MMKKMELQSLAEVFKIGKISRNLKNKKGDKTKLSSLRGGKLYTSGNYNVTSEILYAWICKSYSSKVYLNGSLLKEEALRITY